MSELSLYRCFVVIVIAVLVSCAMSGVASAYRESQLELRTGNLLVQNQAYTTSPIQTLFHSQSVAGTDTEGFALAGTAGGISLAQTSDATLVASDQGFFSASFSFLKFSNPTTAGWHGTDIGTSIASTHPVGSGLIFPSMTRMKMDIAPVTSLVNATPKANNSSTAGNNTINVSAINATLANDTIKREVSTEVGTPGRVNIFAVSPTPTPATAAVAATTAPNKTPSVTLPANEPLNVTLRKAADAISTVPLNRQANKPFTDIMTPQANPRKANRSQIENLSAWDRFTVNVLGRSGIDSTYTGYTAYPGYINPSNSVRLADLWQVASDSMEMTKKGSLLNPRLWTL